MEDYLQSVLVVIGVLVVFTVLFDTIRRRRRRLRADGQAPPVQREDILAADLGDTDDLAETEVGHPADIEVHPAQALEEVVLVNQKTTQTTVDPIRSPKEIDQVIVLNLMAKKGALIDAERLMGALEVFNLAFDDMQGLFVACKEHNGQEEIIFRLAQAVEPGTFDLDNFEQLNTPGIALFLTLPTVSDPIGAFESMLQAARSLGARLDAELMDSQRSVLTMQAIQHYRELAREYARRQILHRRAEES